MDVKKKLSESFEISMAEKNVANDGEVLVAISDADNSKLSLAEDLKCSSSSKDLESLAPKQGGVDSSAESGRFVPSPNKPPKIPHSASLTKRRSLKRALCSKPKSRFGEQSYPLDLDALDQKLEKNMTDDRGRNSPPKVLSNRASPNAREVPVTPKTPLMASPGTAGGVDEYEEIYRKMDSHLSQRKRKKVKASILVEWFVFVCILGCLIASLTVEEWKMTEFWGLEIWKWCVLVMVIFCGMLVTKWFMHFIVFFIERNFLLRKKVLYFVYGLKKSVQVFVWIALVLLTWVLLFNRGVHRSADATKILDHLTWTLVSLLIGAFLWLMKTLFLKILASSFHVNTFFDRIQESVFHQYVLQTLSGLPLMEMAEKVGRTPSTGQMSFRISKKGKEGSRKEKKEVIDIANLQKMKQEKVSAWTMKVLVDVISTTGLSTLSNEIDKSFDEGEEQADKEIRNEMEAIAAAYHIFTNVAQPGSKYIDEDDLLRFMIKEEVDLVFPLIVGSDSGRIDRKALTEWVVKVYQGRKALAHALNDTKTAVIQLNKLVTGILIVVIIIIWLLLMEIATTKVILFLSSQLVVAAFMFGNTCKTIFEAIIFVFVMHPFDVGDRCVVDGTQVIVEEMNILTTVFLRYDNEKIYYPNSVLATKPISNFYRSPEMGDNVDFSVDFKTPAEKIGMLKDKIKNHLEKNSHHWQLSHNLVVKEIENMNKIKMALFINHTINFQDYGEKMRRLSELVLELKKMFEELGIVYNLLPQEVHLKNSESVTRAFGTSA